MIVGAGRDLRVLASGGVALALAGLLPGVRTARRRDRRCSCSACRSLPLLGGRAAALDRDRLWLRRRGAARLGAGAARSGVGFRRADVVLLVVWVTDIGGYFAGRGIGGPKLWPRVSPKKTWAGAVGGFVGSLCVAAGFAALGYGRLAAVAGAGGACCRSSRSSAICSNRRSSASSASRIPARSFPAMAA